MASFRITRVYTRTGDDGSTGLVDGSRLSKAAPRVQAYGDVDELTASLGVARSLLKDNHGDIESELAAIQQELFDLGAELAAPADFEVESGLLVGASEIGRLERLCDTFGEGLAELDSFVLPGTDRVSAALHAARTVARRAERSIIALLELQADSVRNEVVQYVNRLSDLLFILSRVVEDRSGCKPDLWVKPGERK